MPAWRLSTRSLAPSHVHDELDLPGRIIDQGDRRCRGHNGLRDIAANLGKSQDFLLRLRLGSVILC
ncbi:MAG: hypothetical protein H6971_04645 [Gammaproteobacteria bacterium]|nr:hypothetical protein [Gammaproteobacteria bacterium]